MGHDLGGTRGVGSMLRLLAVDFHLVALAGLAVNFLLLLDLVFALVFDVDAACLRHLILLDPVLSLSISVLYSLHGGVFLLRPLTVGIGNLGGQLGLLVGELVSAVLFVVNRKIGLGLFGGEFCRSGGFRIPKNLSRVSIMSITSYATSEPEGRERTI